MIMLWVAGGEVSNSEGTKALPQVGGQVRRGSTELHAPLLGAPSLPDDNDGIPSQVCQERWTENEVWLWLSVALSKSS